MPIQSATYNNGQIRDLPNLAQQLDTELLSDKPRSRVLAAKTQWERMTDKQAPSKLADVTNVMQLMLVFAGAVQYKVQQQRARMFEIMEAQGDKLKAKRTIGASAHSSIDGIIQGVQIDLNEVEDSKDQKAATFELQAWGKIREGLFADARTTEEFLVSCPKLAGQLEPKSLVILAARHERIATYLVRTEELRNKLDDEQLLTLVKAHPHNLRLADKVARTIEITPQFMQENAFREDTSEHQWADMICRDEAYNPLAPANVPQQRRDALLKVHLGYLRGMGVDGAQQGEMTSAHGKNALALYLRSNTDFKDQGYEQDHVNNFEDDDDDVNDKAAKNSEAAVIAARPSLDATWRNINELGELIHKHPHYGQYLEYDKAGQSVVCENLIVSALDPNHTLTTSAAISKRMLRVIDLCVSHNKANFVKHNPLFKLWSPWKRYDSFDELSGGRPSNTESRLLHFNDGLNVAEMTHDNNAKSLLRDFSEAFADSLKDSRTYHLWHKLFDAHPEVAQQLFTHDVTVNKSSNASSDTPHITTLNHELLLEYLSHPQYAELCTNNQPFKFISEVLQQTKFDESTLGRYWQVFRRIEATHEQLQDFITNTRISGKTLLEHCRQFVRNNVMSPLGINVDGPKIGMPSMSAIVNDMLAFPIIHGYTQIDELDNGSVRKWVIKNASQVSDIIATDGEVPEGKASYDFGDPNLDRYLSRHESLSSRLHKPDPRHGAEHNPAIVQVTPLVTARNRLTADIAKRAEDKEAKYNWWQKLMRSMFGFLRKYDVVTAFLATADQPTDPNADELEYPVLDQAQCAVIADDPTFWYYAENPGGWLMSIFRWITSFLFFVDWSDTVRAEHAKLEAKSPFFKAKIENKTMADLFCEHGIDYFAKFLQDDGNRHIILRDVFGSATPAQITILTAYFRDAKSEPINFGKTNLEKAMLSDSASYAKQRTAQFKDQSFVTPAIAPWAMLRGYISGTYNLKPDSTPNLYLDQLNHDVRILDPSANPDELHYKAAASLGYKLTSGDHTATYESKQTPLSELLEQPSYYEALSRDLSTRLERGEDLTDFFDCYAVPGPQADDTDTRKLDIQILFDKLRPEVAIRAAAEGYLKYPGANHIKPETLNKLANALFSECTRELVEAFIKANEATDNLPERILETLNDEKLIRFVTQYPTADTFAPIIKARGRVAANDHLQQALDEAQQLLAERNAERAQLEEQSAQQREALQAAEQALTDERTSNKQKLADMFRVSEEESSDYQRQIEALTDQLRQTKTTADALDAQISESFQAREGQQSRLIELTKQVAALQSEKVELEEKGQRLEEELRQADENLTETKTTLSEFVELFEKKDAALKAERNNLVRLKEAIADKETEISEANAATARLSKQVKHVEGKFKEQIDSLQVGLENTMNSERAKSEQLEEELAELQGELATKEEALEAHEEELRKTEADLTTQRLRAERFEGEKKSLESQQKKHIAQMTDLHEINEQALNDKEAEISKLREELDKKDDKYHRQVSEYKLLQQQYTSAQEQILALDTKVSKMRDDNRQVRLAAVNKFDDTELREALETQLAAREQEVDTLTAGVIELKAEKKGLALRNDELANQLAARKALEGMEWRDATDVFPSTPEPIDGKKIFGANYHTPTAEEHAQREIGKRIAAGLPPARGSELFALTPNKAAVSSPIRAVDANKYNLDGPSLAQDDEDDDSLSLSMGD